MASKKVLFGMAVLALAFGLALAGCENGVQEVKGEVTGEVSIAQPQVAAPSITEAKTADGKYVIISWVAVDNAGGYSVYLNEKDKKTISSVSMTYQPTNATTYKVDGTTAVNSDTDKWNVKIPLSAAFGAALREYRVGVRSNAGAYDGRDWYDSGIAWGAYYPQIAHPYTALLGTWVKEGAAAGEDQKFVFTQTSNSSQPISYVVYSQSGIVLTSGSLYTYDISGETVSFQIYISYSSANIVINTAGKLVVSNAGYGYLNTTFVKQQ